VSQLQAEVQPPSTVIPLPGVHTLIGGEALAAQGVDTVFALPGVRFDSLFAALHDAQDSLRVIHIQQDDFGGRVIASELINPDYRKLAEAFGVTARRAEFPAVPRVQLRETIRAQEASLIELPIGPTPNLWKTLGRR
jgi:thiamine pyrophosphate-dependent acetolactate synthase large subunit-like protein